MNQTSYHAHTVRQSDEMLHLLHGFGADLTQRNAWLVTEDGTFSLYVRRSHRLVTIDGNRELVPCVDLATADISDTYWGNGIFTRFLTALIRENRYNLFAESVINERLAAFLLRHGFQHALGSDPLSPNLYLLKRHEL